MPQFAIGILLCFAVQWIKWSNDDEYETNKNARVFLLGYMIKRRENREKKRTVDPIIDRRESYEKNRKQNDNR
jgi:hypothetical protein